jgi:hypothetical protein
MGEGELSCLMVFEQLSGHAIMGLWQVVFGRQKNRLAG